MDDSVSALIVGTCRIFPKFDTNVFESMHLLNFKELETCRYIIVCGSCAEFFIQPLQRCFDDIDYLVVASDCLVFTNEKPILPYAVRHIAEPIECLLMEPYLDYPAFVRLRILGEVSYDWEQKTFEFTEASIREIIETNDENYSNDEDNNEEWYVSVNVGPAIRFWASNKDSETVDMVYSMGCPMWPNQARHWPIRKRKYGWPTTAIIQEVVQNGCHVVPAKHPACRSDMYQWRLSFSVAEIILLQSWTTVQQIVYHMLKFFAKRELTKIDCPKEDMVLCTYHLKTLMLWSCEEVSPEWWNSSSVVQLCCSLLRKLEKWLKETTCRNYFIADANLFHKYFNKKIVNETTIKLVYYSNSDILSLWFLEHYMQPRFPGMFNANCTHDGIGCEYLLAIREVMKASNPIFIDIYFSTRFLFVAVSLRESCREVSVCVFKYSLRFVIPLGDNMSYFLPAADYESCYWFFASMLLMLNAASLLECKELDYGSDIFLEVIRQVLTKSTRFRSKYHILPKPLNTGSNLSQLYFLEALDLMENLTGSKDDLEFHVVSEISKGLIMKALDRENYKRNVITRSSFAYLAALHFATSEYRIVLDLCSRVVMNEKFEKEETEALNAGCLSYIEDIAVIIGFYLIYRKTMDASLHYTKRQFFLDLRLTPQVFVHYLAILAKERADWDFQHNNELLCEIPAFPLDTILMTIANRKSIQKAKKRTSVSCVYQRTDPMLKLEDRIEVSFLNECDIARLLMEYCVVKMTSFYDPIRRDFDIDCSGTVDCYRAAYLYQRRKYPEVLHLCERILNEPDLKTDLKELAFANVIILPPLDSLFDREIQNLLGFRTLVSDLSQSSEDLWEIQDSEMSTSKNEFVRGTSPEKALLFEVLLLPYSKKCHYFIGRYFLARYLRVRCQIDCNSSLSEVESEFKKLKACLPFEQLMRLFLEQNLRQLPKFVDGRAKVGLLFNGDKVY